MSAVRESEFVRNSIDPNGSASASTVELFPVITGYNTDVSHNSRYFHVQTEDKGSSNPFIESLIYVGGQVLAAKRTGYAEVLEEGKGNEAIIAMMDRQHRSMISAIRSGEFDSKVIELLGEANGDQAAEVDEVDVVTDAIAKPSDRTLDEVILEYLATESEQEQLVLELDEQAELSYGATTPLQIRTSLSRSGDPVADAEIIVRMISTMSEPRVLATGRTGEDGVVSLPVTIPDIAQGSSALIIAAASSTGRAELKYLL